MFNFGQQHQLQKGLKLFGLKGEIAAKQELSQLIKRNCYEPIDASTMTDPEKKKVCALNSEEQWRGERPACL